MQDLTPCLDARSLQQLLLGQVPDEQAEAMEQHLLHCSHCIERMRMVKDEGTLLTDIRQGADLAAEVPQEGPEIEALVGRMRSLTESATFCPTTTATTVVSGALGGATGDKDRTEAEGFRDCLLPAQEAGEIGRLGPYRVLKVLGKGGMGVVFQAEDPQLQRCIALKVMRSRMAGDQASRERFLREARAAAQIEHDHIIAVYHVGEDHGIPYLAMPLLQGETLDSRLDQQGVLPIADALRIAREIAAGLAAAHARGLIHRDIKPSNIWLEAGSGRVKILDFGLTRLAQENVQLTKAGYILGTPSYMAPEQVQSGNPVDGRCDLYSLGVVLFRMTTGRLPFVQDDLMSLLAAVASEQPKSPRSLNPAVPPELDHLILRLLAKKPSERPESAEAVVESLRTIENGKPLASKPARCRSRALIVAALSLILLGVAVPFAGPAIYRILTDQGELVITSDDPDVNVVIKRGGEQIEVVDLKTNNKLLLRSGQYEIELSGNREKLRLDTDKFTLSRNGRQIVSVKRVQPTPSVAKMENNPDKPAHVGQIRVFNGHKLLVSSVAFSGDGSRAVSGSYDKTVYLWDVNTGQPLKTFKGHTKTVRSVAISGNGERIASGGGDEVVRLWDVATGRQVRELPGHTGTITRVAFFRDGKRLASSGLDQSIRLWNAVNGKGDGAKGNLGQIESVAASPDGRSLLCGGQDQLVRLWDTESDNVQSWEGHAGVILSVAFSPDGRHAASGGADGKLIIWEPIGGKELHHMQTPEAVQSVAFTPDGKRVLAGYGDGVLRLWDVSSCKEIHRFTGHRSRVWSVAVSTDGRFALSGGEDRTVRLWGLPEPE